jgi:protein involved in polysaccharide export with SLBB domain
MVTASVLLLAAVSIGQVSQLKPADGKPLPKKTKGTTSVPMTAPSPAPENAGDDAEDKAIAGEILPYYQNYLSEYRLGPSDVISVEVFGQCPDYCKTNITIPPNARISYPLIAGGVMVAGKTVEQIAAEITKNLDEFIIDPKVTVTLDKAVATRYSVTGKVGTPGVHVMGRKINIYEAVQDAGGVTKEGDKKKVAIVSYTKEGKLSRRIINLADMEAGKIPVIYLSPGDQVFVPGKGFSMQKVLRILTRISTLTYMIPGMPNIPIPYGLPF